MLRRRLVIHAPACGLALLATTLGRGVAVAEAIRLVARLDDVAVMRETVNQTKDDASPLAEARNRRT
jgi:hypothetical protein